MIQHSSMCTIFGIDSDTVCYEQIVDTMGLEDTLLQTCPESEFGHDSILKYYCYHAKKQRWKTYAELLYVPGYDRDCDVVYAQSPYVFGLRISDLHPEYNPEYCQWVETSDIVQAFACLDPQYATSGYKDIPIARDQSSLLVYHSIMAEQPLPENIPFQQHWNYDFGYCRNARIWVYVLQQICKQLQLQISIEECKWMLVWIRN